jgi:hypothetical protein
LSRNFRYQVSPSINELDPELEKAIEAAAVEEEEQEELAAGLQPKEAFFLFCLLFSLFFADVWEYQNYSEEYNIVRNVIIIVLITIFFIEIALNSIEDHFYFGGTFFWLDIIGSLVLLLETTWIFEFIVSGGSVTILRASKEIFRLMVGSMKMLRAIRPLFATVLQGYNIHCCDEKPVEKDRKKLTKEQLIIRDEIEGRKIEITEAFAFRIAGVVMVLIIIVPFLQVNLNDTSADAWLTNFKMIGRLNTTTATEVDNMVYHLKHFYYEKDTQLHFIKFECPWIIETIEHEYHTRHDIVKEENILEYITHYSIPNSELISSTNPYALQYVHETDCLECETEFEVEIHLDSTRYAKYSAAYSMIATLLVILVLFFGTSTITTSMETLILNPLKDALLTLSNHAWGDPEPHRLEKIVEENDEDEDNRQKKDVRVHPVSDISPLPNEISLANDDNQIENE